MNGKSVWQSQALEAPCISLHYVRRQAERLNSDIRRELRLAYVGTAFCALLGLALVFVPATAWSAVGAPEAIVLMVQLTTLLSLFACGYIAFQIRRRGKLQLMEDHERVMQSLCAYRVALERRRDHYASAWRWSFWPVIPGMFVVLGGGWLFDERPGKWLRLSVAAAVCALATVGGAWAASHKSKGFQREIDALNTLAADSPPGA